VGEQCPSGQLFILQYEVDKDGVMIKDTLRHRPVINLENRSSRPDVRGSAPALIFPNPANLAQKIANVVSEKGKPNTTPAGNFYYYQLFANSDIYDIGAGT
jgi:hypothetical protein